MLSPNMRVREFVVNDFTQLAVTVGWADIASPGQVDHIYPKQYIHIYLLLL